MTTKWWWSPGGPRDTWEAKSRSRKRVHKGQTISWEWGEGSVDNKKPGEKKKGSKNKSATGKRNVARKLHKRRPRRLDRNMRGAGERLKQTRQKIQRSDWSHWGFEKWECVAEGRNPTDVPYQYNKADKRPRW